jgi:uncharacterized SAM-binding protein YcdF (DUF218 family)
MADWIALAVTCFGIVGSAAIWWWFRPDRERMRIYSSAVQRCRQGITGSRNSAEMGLGNDLAEDLKKIIAKAKFRALVLDENIDFIDEAGFLRTHMGGGAGRKGGEDVTVIIRSFYREVRNGLARARNERLRHLADHASLLDVVSGDDNVERAVPALRGKLSELSRSDRIDAFRQWEKLVGGFPPVPDDGRVVAPSITAGWPAIDTGPMNRLLDAMDLVQFQLPDPPMTQADYEELRAAKDQACDALFRNIQNSLTDGVPPPKLRALLDAVYDYLSEEDPPKPGEENFVAFVPGYRGYFRAERAGELYREGTVSHIYLSGGQPRVTEGDPDLASQIGEGLAMEIYLTDVCDKTRDFISPQHILVDDRARTTSENVLLSRPALRRLKKELDVLRIVAVTSPFHLRRTYLMLQRFAAQNPGLVDDIRRVASASRYMRKDWFRTPKGLRAYVTEYWKVHGGRLIGEF